VVDVIEHDPVLLMRMFKLVNSPCFGLTQKITSVSHAVVYVGINTVKNMALSTAALGALPRRNEAGVNIDDFLLHSLSTAAIAKILAKKIETPAQELANFFLCGLVHDFGKIVFTTFLANDYKKTLLFAKEKGIPLHAAEMEVLGTDHAQVGSLLAEKWRLPSSVVECIKNHHSLDTRQHTLTDAVFAANQLSKKLEIGYSGDGIVQELPDRIYRLLGMPDIENLVSSLGNVNASLDKTFLL
jgi:putative nucleotidyltransferase with HDIG domain